MHRPRLLLLLTPLAIALTIAILTGCGGGSDESLVHMQGSSETITKPMLNHWMRTMAGGDFREAIGTKGPAGLVSEPANYPECEAAASKVAPKTPTGKPKPGAAQIARKCRQLYRSVKGQTLSFLLSVQWETTLGAEQGIKVSHAELQKEFENLRAQTFPTDADLRRYLEERNWVLSDIYYQLKRNIIVRRLLPNFLAKVKRAGGGEVVYAKLALERYKRQIARTSCKPGFVAPGCREYHGSEIVLPPVAVLLEDLTAGRSS
jgi:hypothetical protein